MEKRHRVNVYLSEEEYELLKNRQNESGKSQSEVLKESLYREQDIMDAKFSDSIFRIACWIEEREYDKIREEVKKYVNASGDIQNANRLLDLWMTSLAGAGFSEVESANNRMSETRLFSSEAIKAAKMEELYRRAYEILYDNRDFLLAVQKELLEHETLLNSDLAKIRESCT